ncbi:MAG: hypothetical protein NXI24_17140 [bacterium]|nr:hypothetical protein [bacterium]
MPDLANADSTVQCTHGGSCTATKKISKVKAKGAKLIPKGTKYAVSGCSLPPPIVANGPCVMGQGASQPLKKVKSGGKKVAAKKTKWTCTPTGSKAKIADTQSKVKGK